MCPALQIFTTTLWLFRICRNSGCSAMYVACDVSYYGTGRLNWYCLYPGQTYFVRDQAGPSICCWWHISIISSDKTSGNIPHSLIREWKKGGGRGVELIFGWKAWCPRKNIYVFLHLVTFFSFLSLFSRLQIRSKSGSSNNSEMETCSSIWIMCDSVDEIFLGQ